MGLFSPSPIYLSLVNFISSKHNFAQLSARCLLVLRHSPGPRLQGVAIVAPQYQATTLIYTCRFPGLIRVSGSFHQGKTFLTLAAMCTSGITSGFQTIIGADGASHFCSRCEACTSTWHLRSSLPRDGCLATLEDR